MAREAIAQLILFVAVVTASAVFVGVVLTETATLSEAIERSGDHSATELDAEIALVADPESGAVVDDGVVTLYVKNVGGSTLEPDELDVLLDGEYHDPAETRVLDGEYWRPGRLLEVTVETAVEPGDLRVVVGIRGAEDRLEFEHRIAFWEEPADADCADGVCTVANDTVVLTMATEPAQDGESVAYAVNDTSVATVSPETGVTGADGTHETTLEFQTEGTVAVALDVGWDEDEIVVRYEAG